MSSRSGSRISLPVDTPRIAQRFDKRRPVGCDLAGAIPNCKAIVADLVAKGVKGTGGRMEAAKPADHVSWQDKPIMSDKEWAAFQRDMSRQNLERYESEGEVDGSRKRVQHIERIIDRDRFEGRAPLR